MSLNWLSLGENCLSQNIINDLGLKTLTSPFAWTSVTIDHILNIQDTEFSKLDYDYYPVDTNGIAGPWHKTSKNSDDSIFAERHHQMYFFHNDFLAKEEEYNKIARRFERYHSLAIEKNVFLYHYRYSNNMNVAYVRSKLEHFIATYYPNSVAVLLYQTIAPNKSVNLVSESNSVLEFDIHTDMTWDGENWNAKNDRWLHKEMIDVVSSILEDIARD